MRRSELQQAIKHRMGCTTVKMAKARKALIVLLDEYPDIETNLRFTRRGCIVPCRGWSFDGALEDFIERATQHDYRRHRRRQKFAGRA